jgi:hypothetical protein
MAFKDIASPGTGSIPVTVGMPRIPDQYDNTREPGRNFAELRCLNEISLVLEY